LYHPPSEASSVPNTFTTFLTVHFVPFSSLVGLQRNF
jgi:hypothetical protein